MANKVQNTYIQDPEGIERASAQLRKALADEAANPPGPEAYAWQNDLPELPDDDDPNAVEATFFKGK